MKLRAFATPDTIHEGDLDGACAVVIDALRMTSVAAQAIENGCAGILPVGTIEEAFAIEALRGGERNALPIKGFDFSNSPVEYTAPRVSGKRLVMTTTNGTRAILACKGARRVLLGAFVNASAVARAIMDEEDVALVCAGTLGAFTLEDALAAGAIAEHFSQAEKDDMALAAIRLYAQSKTDLHAALAPCAHCGRLLRLGLSADLDFCLSVDTKTAVPERRGGDWFV